MEIELPHNWAPRDYQLPSWSAWESGVKRLLLVWHRRAGKDDVALNMAAVAAHLRPANYWHCLPLYEQARKAIWEAINPHTGKRRIDEAFPLALRKRTDNSSMTIEFKTGSIWRVVGSDNPDSLVGAPPLGIVFSEWALSNPSAWGYLAPILAENGGWAAFITTPRGRNHVKSMLDMAKANPQWFAEVLTPKETGFPIERIEEQRREYHAIFGQDAGDALIDQEYWCSFEAAILGAYYSREMLAVERTGRLGDVPIEPGAEIDTAWDLGVGDSTAIWVFQQVARQVRVIDYYEASGYGPSHYVKWLNERGYNTGFDYLPHDARQRDWSNEDVEGKAKSRIMELRDLKRNVRLLPNSKIEDGINAARRLLPLCVFHEERCAKGLEALRQYRRAWDDDKKVFSPRPLHDWSSHGADAFRYLAMGIHKQYEPIVTEPKPLLGVNQMTFDQMIKHSESQRSDMV